MEPRIPEELISILTKDVPKVRRDDLKCRNACLDVLKELATPEDIEGVCFHEAGHFIYAGELGLKVGFGPDEIEMCGPSVIYNPNPTVFQTEFEPSPGRIRTPFRQMGIKLKMNIMKMLANIAVAGGVFAGKFVNQPTRGTSGDIEAFENYYRESLNTVLKNMKDRPECSDFLDEARIFVPDELDKSPEMQLLARQLADRYKLQYFLPFLDCCDLNSDSG